MPVNESTYSFFHRLLGNTGNRAGTTSWKTEILSFSNSTHPMHQKRNHERAQSVQEELMIQLSWASRSYTVCWFSYFSLELRSTHSLFGQKCFLSWPCASGPELVWMILYNTVPEQKWHTFLHIIIGANFLLYHCTSQTSVTSRSESYDRTVYIFLNRHQPLFLLSSLTLLLLCLSLSNILMTADELACSHNTFLSINFPLVDFHIQSKTSETHPTVLQYIVI